jgi:DNA-binding response OmpR family regulator
MLMDKNVLGVLENKSVLYAEDENGIRENVTQILELFFEKVYVAKDGKEACEIYDEYRPDVVMVDICMPHVDGLDVISYIRKSDRKTPVIVLSAHRDEQRLWRAVEQKITKYLTKPFDKNMLMEALRVCALELVEDALEVHLTSDISYNPSQKCLICKDQKIPLTLQESRLLEYFIACRGKTVTFEAIEDHLWGYDAPGKEALKAVIKSLRKKIGKEVIKNHYGIGYSID